MARLTIKRRRRRARILDFDIESRPLSFTGSKFNPNTKEITAIAWQFIGEEDTPNVICLGRSGRYDDIHDEAVEMLGAFVGAYEKADVVTGHYIRGFDLPHVNAALLEYGFPLLRPIATQDTCSDLKKLHGIQKGQEPLAYMLRVEARKHHPNWREGNRLTTVGRQEVIQRVRDDVTQHIQLREKAHLAGVLSPGKMWKP